MAFAIATLNVKDLLEPNDPRDLALLPAKLDWIARNLRACDADVVGLQEVGQAWLLDAVLGRLAGCGYGAPVIGTADARGIRCALVSRCQIIAARVHTATALPFPVFCEGDPEPFAGRIPLRRGIVHAQVEAPDIGPVNILVAHFKSSRPVPLRTGSNGPELSGSGDEGRRPTARERSESALRSSVWRAAEALFVRGLVDDVLTSNPRAHAAVVGDLNDLPDSMALRSLRAEGAEQLVDCAAQVAPDLRYSTLHGGNRVQIDYVLATPILYARLGAAFFLNADLREHPPADSGCDARLTVDSDHAPLVVRFD